MEKILETINKVKSNKLMKKSSENFVFKLDESNSDKVDVSFDMVSDYNSGKVNVSIEKFDESSVLCHVHTSFKDYSSTVFNDHLYDYISAVAADTEQNLWNV